MFHRMIRPVALCGFVVLGTSSASAQFFPGSSIDPCAPAVPVAATTCTQVAALPAAFVPQQRCVTICQPEPLVPVAQTTYQTVPVTEYQPVKRTVERPVVETNYVDQEVTAYRPITETRVSQVPTVNYHNVTEYHTVTRDMGQWVTQRECINRISPCQYDGRPGLAGEMNRFGYSLRSAFSPSFRTRRDYVPNYVAQAVPVTRQVAVPGTRQVTYNVTKLEPYKTTRKVAVNSVRMVAEQVTEMHPVTVMRTIPTGTRVAYVPHSSLGRATASLPGGPRSASTVVRSRTADARNEEYIRNRPAGTPAYDANNPKPFRRTEPFRDETKVPPATGQIQHENIIQNTSQLDQPTQHAELWESPAMQHTPTSAAEPAKPQYNTTARPVTPQPPVRPSRSIPSIVRVNRWTRHPQAMPSPTFAPKLATPGISVAVD